MLESVREYIAERLAARPDSVRITHRHAQYYERLAVRADEPLRGRGQPECLHRLRFEAGNFNAVLRWELANKRGRLPLLRVLWLLWAARDVDTVVPSDTDERTWAAAATALWTSDDCTILAAHRQVGNLLARISIHPRPLTGYQLTVDMSTRT
jgi:hypothetical protein